MPSADPIIPSNRQSIPNAAKRRQKPEMVRIGGEFSKRIFRKSSTSPADIMGLTTKLDNSLNARSRIHELPSSACHRMSNIMPTLEIGLSEHSISVLQHFISSPYCFTAVC